MTVLLSRRATVQAVLETEYGTSPNIGNMDGILVSEPTYTADPALLERDFTRDTLSQQSHIIGRLMSKMEFTTELRGNGKQDSGRVVDAPIITRLFRACGYEQTLRQAPYATTVFERDVHDTRVTWTSGGTLISADIDTVIRYELTVSTAGVSGTAMLTYRGYVGDKAMPALDDAESEVTTPVAIAGGTPITIGTKGLTLTPAWDNATTVSLAEDQKWIVWLMPTGINLSPISANETSAVIVMNKDGVRHVMPGSYGTFEITAMAGEYATVKWTFMGLYEEPVDAFLPQPIYERALPSQVEHARLLLDEIDSCPIVEKFTFNQANDVQIRPDVCSEQGYVGTRIVSRSPEGGIDPEAALVASYDFWGKLRAATRMAFQMRVGTERGNIVWILAPSVQYTQMTYSDRQGLLTYDAGLKFAGYHRDDEIMFHFS